MADQEKKDVNAELGRELTDEEIQQVNGGFKVDADTTSVLKKFLDLFFKIKS